MTFAERIKDILTVTMTLFAVIDIIGSVPIIIDLKKRAGGTLQSGKATIVAGVIMISFVFFGDGMLNFIGISVNSFAVAGSLIVLFFAVEMILGVQLFKGLEAGTASVVPLAFPLIAGAGSLTTIVSLLSKSPMLNVVIGIIINLLLVYIVLRNSQWIEKKLGTNGIGIVRQIFGIILLAIGIQMFASNITALIGSF